MRFIESLERRLQYASVSGVLWNDLDRSKTYDANESPLKRWNVYIDGNANGRYDAGEPLATTDTHGRYTFSGLKAADYLIGVIPKAGFGQTSPGYSGSVAGQFKINLKFTGTLTPTERAAFVDAAARWESILSGVISRGNVTPGAITISATVDSIDGVDGTLAQSGPTKYSSVNHLPTAGDMEFDSADIGALEKDNQLVSTVTHEMAHVLGFGTIWDTLGLIQGAGTRSTRFTGREAVKQYDAMFQATATSVPLEYGGGDGTADSHWRESLFQEELMTGYVEDPGTFEPLSRVTVGQFADLGYQVNLNAADVWDPLTHYSDPTTPIAIGGEAYEARVTTSESAVAEADFGYRADTAPVIYTFAASPTRVSAGTTITLAASHGEDAENDPVLAVSFWRESNGKPGLQTGRGGDSYISTQFKTRRRAWRSSTTTTGLAAGVQTFYAVAQDDLGLASKTSTLVTIRSSTAMARASAAASPASSIEEVIKLIDA